MRALGALPEKQYAHQTGRLNEQNRLAHTNTNKKGEETGRESNNSMFSADASCKCIYNNNKSTVCVHCGLHMIGPNFNGRCLEIIHKSLAHS